MTARADSYDDIRLSLKGFLCMSEKTCHGCQLEIECFHSLFYWTDMMRYSEGENIYE